MPDQQRGRDHSVPAGEARKSASAPPTEKALARARREPLILLAALAAAVILSGVCPRNRPVWLLEEAPVLVGIPVLIFTRRRFPLTPLSYRLIFLHALLLVVGSHYTFSKVPLGLWLRDTLGLSRNPYDRIVHLVGGIAPAIVGREILRRRTPLPRGGWLFFLVSLGCLGGSAFYELLEWCAAAATGVPASEFLATQGDVWDTQWDMFLGLAGAILAQWVFTGVHERQLDALARKRVEIGAG